MFSNCSISTNSKDLNHLIKHRPDGMHQMHNCDHPHFGPSACEIKQRGRHLATVHEIRTHSKEGCLKNALKGWDNMLTAGSGIPHDIYVSLLHVCATAKATEQGKRIHAHIVTCGIWVNPFLWNTLLNMYIKCGSIVFAHHIFSVIPEHDLCTWTTIIGGYANHADVNKAIYLFQHMKNEGLVPNRAIFLSILRACTNTRALEEGKEVEKAIKGTGYEYDTIVVNTIIDMYSKCGCIENARELFNRMRIRDLVSWNVMILGYVRHGDGKEALALLGQMKQVNLRPNRITFLSILNGCAQIQSFQSGKLIHASILSAGIELDLSIENALIDMYSKCGSTKDACLVFDLMPTQDIISWNAMIVGYALHEDGKAVIRLFSHVVGGTKPDNITLASTTSACINLAPGKWLHAHVIRSSYESDIFVESALIDMYAKSGSLGDACQIFKKMSRLDVVSWTALVSAFTLNGYCKEAIHIFHKMEQNLVKPNGLTLISILNTCTSMSALDQGKWFHAYVLKNGHESIIFVQSTLIDMYAKCGSIQDARFIFNIMHSQDAVLWSTMISGYAQHRNPQEALTLFWQMQEFSVEPNEVTLVSILNVIEEAGYGKHVHAHILQKRYTMDIFVENALLDMYAKNGSLNNARKLFNNMRLWDVVSWSTMIRGYAQNGGIKESLKLFKQMQEQGLKASKVTLVCILGACATIAALEQGKELHCLIITNGWELDATLGNILINMYAKCGKLSNACQVFERLFAKDAVAWSVMIAGYAQHGHGKAAVFLFRKMQEEGVQPDEFTFLSILSGCSQIGLLDDGSHLFNGMSQIYGSVPTQEHHITFIDLLSRSGCIDEAEDVLNCVFSTLKFVAWTSFLSACSNKGREGACKEICNS